MQAGNTGDRLSANRSKSRQLRVPATSNTERAASSIEAARMLSESVDFSHEGGGDVPPGATELLAFLETVRDEA